MSGRTGGRQSLVSIADVQVPILAACTLIGMELPPGIGEGRAVKVHCPFGTVHHVDGGIEAAMRIYCDSNHVYCFAGCGGFGPVALVSHAFDLTRRTAARELLDRIGYRIVRDDVWTEEFKAPAPDTARLTEALKTFCRRTEPEWSSRQFQRSIADQLGACLSLLAHVKTADTATLWLDTCKTVMARALRGNGDVSGDVSGAGEMNNERHPRG